MAEWIVRETDQGSQMLTEAEAENNCLCVADALRLLGWKDAPIAGVCGNMWTESHINPGQWELGQKENFNRGYGLGQWTPATKLRQWAEGLGLDWRGNGPNQLKFLDETPGQWNISYDPGAPSRNPPVTFAEYKVSDLPVATLSDYWLYYWEQPSYEQSAASKQTRRDHAQKYYTLITGHEPDPGPGPAPTPSGSGKINLFLWCKRVF